MTTWTPWTTWPMDSTTVLVKTARGTEEIRTRALGLSQRIRTLLILIDGRKPVAELQRLLPSLPEAAQVLEALVRGGFVTVKSAPQPHVLVSVTESPATLSPQSQPPGLPPPSPQTSPPPPSAAQSAPAVRPAPNEDVRHAVSELCRILHDKLGPDSDVITVKIETARTRVEFAHAVRRGISLLQVITGAADANRFQARAQAILDTYFAR